MSSKMIPYSLPPREPAWQTQCAAEMLADLRLRRSCRYFSPRPVPRELLLTALEIAHTAPSGGRIASPGGLSWWTIRV